MTMMMNTLLAACIILMASTLSAGQTIDDLDLAMKDLALRVGKLEADLDEKQSKKTSAFSATNRQTLSVARGQKVAFPDVTVNHGICGYDPKTGVYAAPANGLYRFTARITVDCTDCVLLAYLRKNGASLAGIGVHDKDYYDGMTTSAVTILETGDQVYLQTDKVEGGAAVYGHTFSSFSGVLLEAY